MAFDYTYPHAVGTVPADAPRVVDAKGLTWALSTVRAVPTGLYLWGRLTGDGDDPADPRHFRTRAQMKTESGLSVDAERYISRAESTQTRNGRH